ncbi:MAG: preprotein translocase subunit YajC [Planctomycetes bacterium]|nr:preprotein translocase subunit YajC [Planctomycetota bacterium]
MFSIRTFLSLAAEAPPPAQDQNFIWKILIPYFVVISILYFLMSGPKRKDQARRDEALKSLKKNDRVITIGGIYGSVVNISQDGKEVTLKVDDSTRIKFRKTAIAEVLVDEAPTESTPKPA